MWLRSSTGKPSIMSSLPIDVSKPSPQLRWTIALVDCRLPTVFFQDEADQSRVVTPEFYSCIQGSVEDDASSETIF